MTAPSGGAIHSTVGDMARWALFNLSHGELDGRQLIRPDTLAEIHRPQIVCGTDPSSPSPLAMYALGWFVDTYNGRRRIGHGGYLHDVESHIMLMPQDGFGIVSFSNFGFPRVARLLNEHVFDALNGFEPVRNLEDWLAKYEQDITSNRARIASVPHVSGTVPSHPLDAYRGHYEHPGYGTIHVGRDPERVGLLFERGTLRIPLEHWHYDTWIPRDTDGFLIHAPHPLDRSSRFDFTTDVDGEIASVAIPLEPAVAPIVFRRLRRESESREQQP